MTMSNLSGKCRGALLPAATGAAVLALAACHGGGVTAPPEDGGPTVTASAYSLFASNFVRYPNQQNGAFLRSLQGGDVYAVTGGDYGFGCFDFDQITINATQLYLFQAQANPQAGCAAPPAGTQPPITAGDFFLLAFKSPGSQPNSPPVPFDISQSLTLLLQMGNARAPSSQPHPLAGGNANRFTVTLTNDTSLAGDNSQASAVCRYVQTLDGTGTGTSNYPPGPPQEFSAQGTRDYAIPLDSIDWNCERGNVDTLKVTGITAVAIAVTGDENTNVLPGEFDSIAIGKIGFTK
jgi:hypothetical protein